MEPQLYQQLRDIHLPPPYGWWPLAYGWYIIAVLGFALTIILGFYLIKLVIQYKKFNKIWKIWENKKNKVLLGNEDFLSLLLFIKQTLQLLPEAKTTTSSHGIILLATIKKRFPKIKIPEELHYLFSDSIYASNTEEIYKDNKNILQQHNFQKELDLFFRSLLWECLK